MKISEKTKSTLNTIAVAMGTTLITEIFGAPAVDHLRKLVWGNKLEEKCDGKCGKEESCEKDS